MKKAFIPLVVSAPVLALVTMSFVFSLGFVGRPFPGFLVYPNLLISPFHLPGWLPSQEGVFYPWVLDSMDSLPMGSSRELSRSLVSVRQGDIHLFTFRQGNERVVKGLLIVTFRWLDFVGVCGTLFVTGIVIIAVGAYASLRMPWDRMPWPLIFFCLSLGGQLGYLPDWMVSHRFPWVLPFFSSMAPSFALGTLFSFPSSMKGLQGRGWIVPCASVCLGSAIFALYLFASSPERYVVTDMLVTGLFVIFAVFFGLRMTHLATSSPHVKERRIARICLLVGYAPSVLIIGPIGFILYFFHFPYSLFTFSIPLAVLLPGAMAWGVHEMSIP